MSHPFAARLAGLVILPLALTLAPGLAGGCASAGEVELAAQVGRSLPLYRQTFAFDPDDFLPPDSAVRTSGAFDLELGGGLTVSGALTWRLSDIVGIEARCDVAEVELEVTGGQVSVDLGDLLPGLPSIPITGDLRGETRIDRLTPLSLNLQLSVGGAARFVASGGVSYIPATTVAATVTTRAGIDDVPGLPPIQIPGLSLAAAATFEGGFGGNAGVGLRVPLGPHVALLFDARAFGFPKREVSWGSGRESSPIEDALASALDPIELDYGFFLAAGGLAITF